MSSLWHLRMRFIITAISFSTAHILSIKTVWDNVSCGYRSRSSKQKIKLTSKQKNAKKTPQNSKNLIPVGMIILAGEMPWITVKSPTTKEIFVILQSGQRIWDTFHSKVPIENTHNWHGEWLATNLHCTEHFTLCKCPRNLSLSLYNLTKSVPDP